MVRADDEALVQGQLLLERFPGAYPQAALVVAEIQRRRREHHDDKDHRSFNGRGQWSPRGDVPPELWKEGIWPELTCDAAAMTRASLVVGLPDYHPLWKDCDSRRASIRHQVSAYGACMRKLSAAQAAVFGLTMTERDRPRYACVPMPLAAPATTVDVATGRALFSLESWSTWRPVVPAGAEDLASIWRAGTRSNRVGASGRG